MTRYIHRGQVQPVRPWKPAAGRRGGLPDGMGLSHSLTAGLALGLRGKGGMVMALTITAMMRGLRIGDAQNPGPWPKDDVGPQRNGWQVCGSLDAHLASTPHAGGSRATCAFDDPDDFGDAVEPGYGDEGWEVG